MLTLPDETILEILENHLPDYRKIATLYNLSAVCKRLHQISHHLLYQQIILHDGASIYLFLRSLIENRRLSELVKELVLQWRFQGDDNHSYTIEKYYTNGHMRRIYPSRHEIQRLREYAAQSGLEEEYVQKLDVNGEVSMQVRAILLLMSLSNLVSLHMRQDHLLDTFDDLLLAKVQQRRALRNLIKFEREYSDDQTDYFAEYSPIMISSVLPAMFASSIQIVTATCAMMSYVGTRSLDLKILLKSHRHSSSVYTLNLEDCRIDGQELELLLQFPTSLRSLSLVNWHDAWMKPNPFTSVMAALKQVSHSLESLHVARANWTMDNYTPSRDFRDFTTLTRLSVPLEILLKPGSEQLGDLGTLFPTTLVHLNVFLGWSTLSSNLNLLVKLTDEILKTKSKGVTKITEFGSDSWTHIDKPRMAQLCHSAQAAFISILVVKSSNKPFEDYYPFEINSLDT